MPAVTSPPMSNEKTNIFRIAHFLGSRISKSIILLLAVIGLGGCSSANFKSSYSTTQGDQLPSLIRKIASSPIMGGYNGLFYAGSFDGHDYLIIKKGRTPASPGSIFHKVKIHKSEMPFGIDNRFEFGTRPAMDISKTINWTDPEFFHRKTHDDEYYIGSDGLLIKSENKTRK